MKNIIRNFLIAGLIMACVPMIAAPKNKTLNKELFKAIHQGNVAQVKQLLAHGADVNATSLHVCDDVCKEQLVIANPEWPDCFGNLEVVQKYGFALRTIQDFESTPLLEAVILGHDEIVALLIANGAQLHELNLELSIAAGKGYENICKLLIAHGACVKNTNKRINNDKSEGSVLPQSKIDRAFVSEPTHSNYYRANPLIAAAANGHTKVCELLLAHGADANEVGTIQQHVNNKVWETTPTTAFKMALRNGHAKTTLPLIKATWHQRLFGTTVQGKVIRVLGLAAIGFGGYLVYDRLTNSI